MKVVIIGSNSFDSLEYHLSDTLKFLNHDSIIIDISDIININYKYNYHAIKYINTYSEFVFNKIASKTLDLNPDLIIVTYRFTHPICIKKLKKNLANVPIIHINPDALTTFENQQIFLSDYDAYFTKDSYIVDFMKNKLKLNTYYLPEALNPRVHKKPTINKKEAENNINIDVSSFGTMYPYRTVMLEKLIKSGININLFGTPRNHFGINNINNSFSNEFITGTRKAEILYGSKIVFNNFHYAEINSVNVKFFEIYGVGAFQICDYKESIREFSTVDHNKFTYKSIDEAIELIKYYLNHENERISIANIQYEHFHKFHTYEKRLEFIFNTIF